MNAVATLLGTVPTKHPKVSSEQQLSGEKVLTDRYQGSEVNHRTATATLYDHWLQLCYYLYGVHTFNFY